MFALSELPIDIQQLLDWDRILHNWLLEKTKLIMIILNVFVRISTFK